MAEPPTCPFQDHTKPELLASETDTSGKSFDTAIDAKAKEKASGAERKFQSETDALNIQVEALKKSKAGEEAKRRKLEKTVKSLKGQMTSSKIKRGPGEGESNYDPTPAECLIESIDKDDEDSDDGNNYAVLSENGGWQIMPPC